MEFREFIKSRFCKPLVLAPEDEVQDVTEWRRLVREDQERQFQNYVGGVTETAEKTDEERRVEQFLASKNLPVPVEAQLGGGTSPPKGSIGDNPNEVRESTSQQAAETDHSRGGQKFDKVAYQREYMRKRRAAQKAK